jgi:hypothetical protein
VGDNIKEKSWKPEGLGKKQENIIKKNFISEMNSKQLNNKY